MCCRLTRLLLKTGAIEQLRCPLQIRTTNKADSIVPNFPKGVVSEHVLLPESPRLADLKTGPNFPKGLFQKTGAIEPLRYPLQIRTTSTGGSIASTFPKVSFQKTWCYRTAAFSENERRSIAPIFISYKVCMYKYIYIYTHASYIWGSTYMGGILQGIYKVFQVVF